MAGRALCVQRRPPVHFEVQPALEADSNFPLSNRLLQSGASVYQGLATAISAHKSRTSFSTIRKEHKDEESMTSLKRFGQTVTLLTLRHHAQAA